ncbi:MAG: hypothetical protein ACOYNR_02995 [Blastocatellia bacterium]
MKRNSLGQQQQKFAGSGEERCERCRLVVGAKGGLRGTALKVRDEEMKKAKLIKKGSPVGEELLQGKKGRKAKGKVAPPKSTIEVTKEWLQQKREGAPNAREAFASLFGKTDPQSA